MYTTHQILGYNIQDLVENDAIQDRQGNIPKIAQNA